MAESVVSSGTGGFWKRLSGWLLLLCGVMIFAWVARSWLHWTSLMLFWTLLGVVNLVTLLLYGYDKVAASRGWWRVAERTLHLFALLGGSPAAFAAQKMFRHKSVKPSFRRVFWGIVVLQVAAIGAYWIWA